MDPVVGIGLAGLCVLSQGFFSGSEMAIVSANRSKLEAKRDMGNRGAALALELLSQEERLLATCLVGTNMSVVTGTTLATLLVLQAGVTSSAVATFAFVPFALILGEALPKTVYGHHANRMAPVLAYPLRAIQRVMAPILFLVSGWSALLKYVLADPERGIRRADIVSLLDDKAEGDIDLEDRQLIRRVFELTETAVEDCMTPLVDVHALPDTATVADATEMVLSRGRSRIPIYSNRVDNIVGIVSHRSLLFAAHDGVLLADLVTSAPFVPETKRADELLKKMRHADEHLAIVVDEYGGSVGIVTVEDMVEEILGEIRDERDRNEPLARRLGPREWRVPARVEVDELAQILGVALPEGDYETVAGLLLAALGRIPEAGEVVVLRSVSFHIEEATERAILTVRVVLPPEAAAPI